MVHPEAIKILESWAKFSNYDPDQTRFNLLSNAYHLNRCNKKLTQINEEFDPTGITGVLYAKNVFYQLLKSTDVKLYDVVSDTDTLKSALEMWDMFNGEYVSNIEQMFFNAISSMVIKATGRQLIGSDDEDNSRKILLDSVDKVVEELMNCNVDLFTKGGKFKLLTNISTKIHVFDSIAECLLSINNSQDGVYVCYVTDGGSVDGHFGFYMKSNGNLLSINERLDEAYAGSHSHRRNLRYIEDKKYNLFPYNYVIDFLGSTDYKGYYTKHVINMDKLALFELGPDGYLPLIIAIMLLNNKYNDMDLDIPVKYVDSLMPVNLPKLNENVTALIPVNGNSLTLSHKTFKASFTSEDVRTASIAHKFDYRRAKGAHYKETGGFSDNGVLANMCGAGFEVNVDELLRSSTHISGLLGDGDPIHENNPEFVGTQKRMEMQAYMNGRSKLAEYIRDKIFEEFQACGGSKFIRNWVDNCIKSNQSKIVDKMIEKCWRLKNIKGEYNSSGMGVALGHGLMDSISIFEGDYPYGYNVPYEHILNSSNGRRNSEERHICPITGCSANIWCVIRFRHYTEMEELFGCEVPKILKGWNRLGHRSCTNTILNAHDPVEEVGTPFEEDELRRNSRYKDLSRYDRIPTSFNYAIGLSKRGLNKLMKQYVPDYKQE